MIRLKMILIFLFGLIFMTGCTLSPVKVEGLTMSPTYNHGDKVLIDKNIDNLKRGDVITFLYPKDKSRQYLKRVVGLPNEKIEIRGGKVLVNGNEIDEPYIDQIYNQSGSTLSERIIPENNYFVLGDNRDNSSDSRVWGTVPKELIIGKSYMIYSKAEK